MTLYIILSTVKVLNYRYSRDLEKWLQLGDVINSKETQLPGQHLLGICDCQVNVND